MPNKPTKLDIKIQQVVENLISFYTKDTFKSEFDLLTVNLPTQTKFAIKQELARLFKPFDRTIDVSRNSNYEVFEFSWNGKRFFFDDISKRIFLIEIERFNNQYTAGVFEAVNNSDTYQRYEKQYQYEQKIKSFEVPITELGRTTRRLEERLYCAKPVQITLNNGKVIEAVTSNISRSGCLLRVKPYAAIAHSEIISIDFSALTEQYAFTDKPICHYKVVFLAKTPDRDGSQKVGVQLTDINHEWMMFLDKYVLSNRSNYKVDITNASDLAESRLLEDKLINTSLWLPIFASQKANKLHRISHLLTNNATHEYFDFFQDEKNVSRLNSVIHKIWPDISPETNTAFVVGRIEKQGKFHFIAATIETLIKQKLLAAFIHFVQKNGVLQTFQIRLKSFSTEQIKQIKLNWFKEAKSADEAMSPLLNLNLLISLYPLEQQEIGLTLNENLTIEKTKLTKLNDYLCLKINNHSINQFGIQPKCDRKEQRFFYQTDIMLTAANNSVINTQLLDLSVNGLCIKLDQIYSSLAVGDTVKVTAPKFSQFGDRNALQNALYKIVGINPNALTLHLELAVTEQLTSVKQFMLSLIKNNRAKLSINDQYDKFLILQKALCIAYVTLYPGCALGMLKDRKHQFKFCRLLVSDTKAPEIELLKNLQSPIIRNKISIFQLIHDEKRTPAYLRSIQKFLTSKQVTFDELAFHLLPNRVDMPKQARAGTNERMQLQFMRKALSTNSLSVLNMAMMPVKNNGTEAIEEELKYIARYNKHQADKIAMFANNIIAMVEIIDTEPFWQLIGKIDINKY
ncbi:PilZ domain-containing protein [Catenovulum maritimum]|uniref:PilZ domain-containing protein n=1 Tax=Catenovulum maritimum TaxID=1513271 RepID=A0A0J8H1I1_9ALTE|nr:PilZ domain-containing protein [Catenovulum maritimum]KMT66883.1 hypothetical protein XM47_01920 [Catenovulum maritimum]